MWYRRNFTVPAHWPHTGRSAQVTPINVHFASVQWECHVYINGEHVFPTMGTGQRQKAPEIRRVFPDGLRVALSTPAVERGENTLVVGVYKPGQDRFQIAGPRRTGGGLWN
jgi:hypothetical protein